MDRAPYTKRRYPRRAYEAPFRIRVVGDPPHSESLLDSIDMSVGGAFLQSELLFDEGIELQITFVLPAFARPLRAQGRVVRSSLNMSDTGIPGMGVEFTHLSNDDREAIASFVRPGSAA